MQQYQKQENLQHRSADDVASQETVGQRIEEGAENVVVEAQEEVAAARRPWYQTRRWGGTLLLVYIVLIILFGILAWGVYVHPVLAPDVTITQVFQENQSPWLRTTMLAVSAIGDIQLLSAGLIVLATVIFWLLDLRLEAIVIVAVSVTSGILDALIKSLVARPRPGHIWSTSSRLQRETVSPVVMSCPTWHSGDCCSPSVSSSSRDAPGGVSHS